MTRRVSRSGLVQFVANLACQASARYCIYSV